MDESTREPRESPEPAKAGAVEPASRPPSERLVDVMRRFLVSAPQAGPTRQIAIYRMPRYLQWGVEALAKQMKRGKDIAFQCALPFGLSRLEKFQGISEILRIRSEIVSDGDPEAMSFFEHFGLVDVDTGGASARERPYKREVHRGLAERLGRLAADLGLPQGQLALFALMAAFVDAPEFVKRPEYRQSMRQTLLRFSEKVRARAARAKEHADARPAATTEEPGCSFEDVFRLVTSPSPHDRRD